MNPQQVVKVGVPAIILDEEGRVLLHRRAGKSFDGFWAIPTETVDPGETPCEAAVRGMREELGVGIEVERFTGHYYSSEGRDPRYATAIDLPHVCRLKEGEPKPLSEASEVAWFDRRELSKLNFPYDQRQMLSDAGLLQE